ncbi:MAG: chitobiase/beta-hexosaminidase C-terminal domain-containing protein [Phycisphaeraceae bacterium]
MRYASIYLCVLLTAVTAPAWAVPQGTGAIVLVDGTQTECEILFRHPNADLLILRSARGGTVQSLPVSLVHAVTVGDETTTFSPRRQLTAAEAQTLARNTLWADEPTPAELAQWAEQTWEERPLIVWAEPGVDGNAMQASNWLDERGKPLRESPWQEQRGNRRGPERQDGHFDGDVLLPAADEPYRAIQPGNRDHLGAFRIRHLTVERHGSYEVRYTVAGNLWVKDGAELGQGTQTGGLGSGDDNRHTFARFCTHHDLPDPKWAHAPAISHWVRIDTGDEGSLEVIGVAGGPSDRLTHTRGTLILAEDSFIGNGPRGSFYTQEETTTIMLDGSGMGCPSPIVSADRGTYGISGTLLFGHPDKPLTRDLEFTGNYYRYQDIKPNASPSQRTNGASFVLGSTGRMVIHSADPENARVIFRPRPKDWPNPAVAPWHSPFIRDGRATPELWQQPDIPTGVAAVFLGETDFNGVVFDGFYKGGIVARPDDAAQWKNVSYGSDNHGQPHALLAHPTSHNPVVEIEPDGSHMAKGNTVRVRLRALHDDLPVRYTTDGTIPDRNAPRYESPIGLTDTVTLTAAAFKGEHIYGLAKQAEFRFEQNLNLASLASIEASASFGRNPANLANDLDERTYWRGGTEQTQTLDLTWDEPVTFGQFRLAADRMAGWQFQVREGDQWIDVAEGADSFPAEATFEPVTTTQARLVVEKAGDRPIVHEIEVIESE